MLCLWPFCLEGCWPRRHFWKAFCRLGQHLTMATHAERTFGWLGPWPGATPGSGAPRAPSCFLPVSGSTLPCLQALSGHLSLPQGGPCLGWLFCLHFHFKPSFLVWLVLSWRENSSLCCCGEGPWGAVLRAPLAPFRTLAHDRCLSHFRRPHLCSWGSGIILCEQCPAFKPLPFCVFCHSCPRTFRSGFTHTDPQGWPGPRGSPRGGQSSPLTFGGWGGDEHGGQAGFTSFGSWKRGRLLPCPLGEALCEAILDEGFSEPRPLPSHTVPTPTSHHRPSMGSSASFPSVPP